MDATYIFGFDSNVFTRKAATSSATQSETLEVKFDRRAGVISVNGAVDWSFGQFSRVHGQDFANPGYSLSFEKGIGRTTGSLNLSAHKSTSPDPDANTRPVSWTYGSGLHLEYLVNDRYYVTNTLSASGVLYNNQAVFSNLDTVSDGLAMNYRYDSKLDLNAGYQFRRSSTPDTQNLDNSLTVGASGSITSKISGNLSVGAERRNTSVSGQKDHFSNVTASAALNWRLPRGFSVAGSLLRDYSTTSTDISTETTSAGLSGDFPTIMRLKTSADANYSETQFLGLLGDGRRDTLWQFDGSVGFALNHHLNFSLSYFYQINTSNRSNAVFVRHGFSLTIRADY